MRHRTVLYRAVFLTAIVGAAGPAIAAPTTVSGYFSDQANAALVSSNGAGDPGIKPSQFGSDDNVVRNVAIYQLVVPNDGEQIQFNSTGYYTGGMGNDDDSGAQSYFSLFKGSDGSAIFYDSSYNDPDYDFMVAETLDAGTYLFAIGVYENESLAENAGPDSNGNYGTLSEGFTALGVPGDLGDAFYSINVTSDGDPFTVGPAGPIGATGPTGPPGSTGPNPVPEPSAAALLGWGVVAALVRRRRRGTPAP